MHQVVTTTTNNVIEESPGEVIMFCGELHMLVGAGKLEGSMDSANMLKPRGETKFVGATTLNEHRKSIESDGILARRFQIVYVSEPTATDTISILRGDKHEYEIHHDVKILDIAVISTATYENRYLAEHKLPDSAIDLNNESSPEEIEQLNQLIITLQLKQESLQRQSHKHYESGQSSEKWDIERKAAQIKYNTIPKLEKDMDKINTDSDMEVARTTGILMNQLLATDREKLFKFDKELQRSATGQDSAVDNVSDALHIAPAGLHAHKKPMNISVSLGKTKLAKSLTKFMFNDENAMIRVDMSKYMELCSVGRLIGSPSDDAYGCYPVPAGIPTAMPIDIDAQNRGKSTVAVVEVNVIALALIFSILGWLFGFKRFLLRKQALENNSNGAQAGLGSQTESGSASSFFIAFWQFLIRMCLQKMYCLVSHCLLLLFQ